MPEYGIVDPDERTISLYTLRDGEYAEPQVYREAGTFHFACLPTILVTVKDLFADMAQPAV